MRQERGMHQACKSWAGLSGGNTEDNLSFNRRSYKGPFSESNTMNKCKGLS